MSNIPGTLFDKVWDSHVVSKIDDGPDVFFIDRHFIHEVTSPVAFLELESRGLKVIFPEKTFATADHNTPTINQHLPVQDCASGMGRRLRHASGGPPGFECGVECITRCNRLTPTRGLEPCV